MNEICCEHLTIGTSYSENTDGWNIRDMVAEADYQLHMYYEDGTNQSMMKTSDDEWDRKSWYSETGKLKRFIDAYKPFIGGIKCKEMHCSDFDSVETLSERFGDDKRTRA